MAGEIEKINYNMLSYISYGSSIIYKHFDVTCRYSHAMGNSNGSLNEYWEAIDNTFGLQGGFIWDWVDQVC